MRASSFQLFMNRFRFFPMLLLSWTLLAASSAAAQTCPGDCDASGHVTVDELTLSVNIALGEMSSRGCEGLDSDQNNVVHVHELVAAIRNALEGCPSDSRIQSALERETPRVDLESREELIAGNSEFALDLYRTLQSEEGNLFFSPLSISLAFGLLYPGAAGDTATQIADVMRYTLVDENLHRSFNWLDRELISRGEKSDGADGEEFRLNIANALWGNLGLRFLDSYLDTLARHYGAGLHTVDFARAPEDSREEINRWVNRQTEGRIPNLLPDGTITSDTQLVLSNAIYFNAAWAQPFESLATSAQDFRTLSGSIVSVEMMSKVGYYHRTERADYRSIELPYDGRELSMLIIVPDDLTTFEKQLSIEQLNRIINQLRPERTALRFPRFEYSSKLSLKTTLQDLGMRDAFESGRADLSRITGRPELTIHDVVHEGFIKVNEAGTEAAAATAIIGVRPTSIEPPPRPFVVDQPFLFLIRDHGTGAIVFLGRVVNPQA